MEISVLKDYNQINISSQRHIDALIDKIMKAGLGNDNYIKLDLSDCQTDYPETPKLIAFLLTHLSNIDGIKKLEIIFNGLGNKELYILHDIVLEGSYFNIFNKINSPEEVSEWTKIMNTKLKENSISLVIHYSPENKVYSYGESM